MQLTLTRTLRGAAIALAIFAFVAGLSALSTGSVHAQPATTAAGHSSVLTVDGNPAPPAGCAVGDSWCAYCSVNGTADICSTFAPSMVKGNTTVAGTSTDQAQPALGVEAGVPMIAPVAVVGMSWQWCGTSWLLIGPNGVSQSC